MAAKRIPAPTSIPRGKWRTTRTEILAELAPASRIETELVDRLILNLIQAENAMELAAREPLIVGSRDQEVEHPGFKIAARCDSAALSIALKLGVLNAAEGETEEARPEVEDELAQVRARKAGGA
jgi:hypothetical protein